MDHLSVMSIEDVGEEKGFTSGEVIDDIEGWIVGEIFQALSVDVGLENFVEDGDEGSKGLEAESDVRHAKSVQSVRVGLQSSI